MIIFNWPHNRSVKNQLHCPIFSHFLFNGKHHQSWFVYDGNSSNSSPMHPLVSWHANFTCRFQVLLSSSIADVKWQSKNTSQSPSMQNYVSTTKSSHLGSDANEKCEIAWIETLPFAHLNRWMFQKKPGSYLVWYVQYMPRVIRYRIRTEK